jgi:hypothetical protein
MRQNVFSLENKNIPNRARKFAVHTPVQIRSFERLGTSKAAAFPDETEHKAK